MKRQQIEKLPGCLSGWSGRDELQSGHLRKVMALQKVRVAQAPGGNFNTHNVTNLSLPFLAAWAGVVKGKPWRLQGTPLEDLPVVREILQRHPLPVALNNTARGLFWVSGAQTTTALHFDNFCNLFYQLEGSKTFFFYGPEQSAFLYPLPGNSDFTPSQVNMFEPDREAFPLFSQAVCSEVNLVAGDALLVPAGWWHGVRSDTLGMSLNFFFEP